MKALTVIFLLSLAVCLQAQTNSNTTPNYPYSRYATGTQTNSPKDSPYRAWTTEQLQQKRIELYQTVTRHENAMGVPVYHYHQGESSPQQDQIFAIETELNRRYQAGDKKAELTRPIPGAQHPG